MAIYTSVKNDPNGWEVVCNGKIINDQCDSGPHKQEVQIESSEDWHNYNLKGEKVNGYFLKLGKNVVYSNNSVIRVKYFPNSKASQTHADVLVHNF